MTDIISQAKQLIEANQLQEAFDLLSQTIEQQPNFAEAHALQGFILEYDKQYSAAFDCYLRASQINPVPEWRFSLARCSALSVNTEELILDTLRFYSQLFLLYPEYESELVYRNALLERLGLYVFVRGDEETAEERIVNFSEDKFPTLISYFEYFNLPKLDPDCTSAPEYQPLTLLRNYNDFIYRYPHLTEERASAYANCAVKFHSLGLFDVSKNIYEKVLVLNSNIDPLVRMQAGMMFNLLGDYERGFALAEVRWEQDLPGFNDVPFTYPRWRGENLLGKRVLVVGEQGLGDAIQFVRYVPMLQKQGVYVEVLTKPGLDTFMHDHLMRIGIIPQSELTYEVCNNFDYFLPIMSLAHYFHTTVDTIPFSEGYLTLSSVYRQKWKERIAPTSKLKVGFVFGGNKAHGRNKERSIPFSIFADLFSVDVEFHCLHKELDDEDLALLKTFPNVVIHYEELEDFRDTAGIIEQMDLVISVDTSVAHLSAALGKKTWILITYVPDFRWLLFRSDSPWYKQVVLFRQNIDFKWEPVIDNVKMELARLANQQAG